MAAFRFSAWNWASSRSTCSLASSSCSSRFARSSNFFCLAPYQSGWINMILNSTHHYGVCPSFHHFPISLPQFFDISFPLFFFGQLNFFCLEKFVELVPFLPTEYLYVSNVNAVFLQIQISKSIRTLATITLRIKMCSINDIADWYHIRSKQLCSTLDKKQPSILNAH